MTAAIARNTTTVNEYLVAKGLPQPSFDAGGHTDLTLESKDAEEAWIAAISASIELQDLLQGPIACLRPAVCIVALLTLHMLTRYLLSPDQCHKSRSDIQI